MAAAGREVVGADHGIVGEHDHALDEVLELADVAGRVVRQELGHGFALIGIGRFGAVAGGGRGNGRPAPECRSGGRGAPAARAGTCEAIVQIFAEPALLALARGRLLLVAATSARRPASPARHRRGRTSQSWSTRKSFTCSGGLSPPISSRKTVPRLAIYQEAAARWVAPVKAPRWCRRARTRGARPESPHS